MALFISGSMLHSASSCLFDHCFLSALHRHRLSNPRNTNDLQLFRLFITPGQRKWLDSLFGNFLHFNYIFVGQNQSRPSHFVVVLAPPQECRCVLICTVHVPINDTSYIIYTPRTRVQSHPQRWNRTFQEIPNIKYRAHTLKTPTIHGNCQNIISVFAIGWWSYLVAIYYYCKCVRHLHFPGSELCFWFEFHHEDFNWQEVDIDIASNDLAISHYTLLWAIPFSQRCTARHFRFYTVILFPKYPQFAPYNSAAKVTYVSWGVTL